VRLDGEWLFAPEKFILSPEEHKGGTYPMRVPSSWSQTDLRSAYGYGTYFLRLRIPSDAPRLALFVSDQAIAWRLFINGRPAGENGKPGTSRSDTHPIRQPLVVSLTEDICAADAEGTFFDLAFHISNYHYDVGGLINPIFIGPEQSMHKKRDGLHLNDGFLLGSLLIMAIYHGILSKYNKGDRSSRFFSWYCFLIALRVVAVAHYPERLISGSAVFEISNKIEYLCFYLGLPLYLAFVEHVFPEESKRRLGNFFSIAGVLFSILVVVLPSPVFMAWTTKPYQAITMLGGLYALWVFIRAFINGRNGAGLALGGVTIFLLFVVNDVLHANMIIRTAHLTPVGLMIFTLSQAFIVSIRYGQTFNREIALKAELQLEKDNLDMRIEDRTQELRLANTKLKESDTSKSQVLAMLSHELRTPISLVVAPVEQVLKGRYGQSIPYDSELFKGLKRNGDRLLNVVEGLFNYAKIELGKYATQKKTIDVGETLRFYTAEVEPMAEKKGIGLRLQDTQSLSLAIEADRYLFEIAFFNLISNAVKFTRPGGSIEVSAERMDRTDDETWVEIKVADTGIGIGPDQLPHIFNKLYQRNDAEDSLAEGAGIGLSLTRKIVELHGGTIRAESEIDKGSTFIIALPAKILAAAASEAPLNVAPLEIQYTDSGIGTPSVQRVKEANPDAGNKPHILLVEDNQELRTFLKRELLGDFRISEAENGMEALSMLRASANIDLVVSDIMMPKMDGLRLFKETRSIPECKNIPFLFLTARIDPEERLKALADGAYDYIGKPFSMDEVVLKISNLLRLQRRLQSEALDKMRERLSRFLDETALAPRAGAHRRDLASFGLTERELSIVRCLSKGLSDKEIASELGISPRTVSNTLSRIYKKTGTAHRSDILRLIHGIS